MRIYNEISNKGYLRHGPKLLNLLNLSSEFYTGLVRFYRCMCVCVCGSVNLFPHAKIAIRPSVKCEGMTQRHSNRIKKLQIISCVATVPFMFSQEIFFLRIRAYQSHSVLNGTQVVQNYYNDLCILNGNSVEIVRDIHKVGMRFQYEVPIKTRRLR
jgi:hypothetical protein